MLLCDTSQAACRHCAVHVDERQLLVSAFVGVLQQSQQAFPVDVFWNRQASELKDRWREIDVTRQSIAAYLLAIERTAGGVNHQRHARGFLHRQNFRTVAVGTTDVAVVTGVNHDSVVGNALRFEFVTNHADGHIDAVNLLMVLSHLAIVLRVILPCGETRVLTAGFALRRHVLTKLTTKVGGLGELLASVNMVETRIRGRWLMWGLKTDRQTKRSLLLDRRADHILSESAVGQRGVRVFLSVLFHGLVFCRVEKRLTGTAAPKIKIAFAKSLALDL